MIKDSINSYYNDFVFWMSKSLKSGWGIEMKTYPFPNGAVVVVNLARGMAHHLTIKRESNGLVEALRRTNLFSKDKIKPLINKKVEGTIIGIYSTTRYVLFKDADSGGWNENSAKSDVDSIISKVKSGYGK